MSSDLKSTTISIGEGSILGWTDMRSSMRSPKSGGRGSLGELTFKFHNNFIWKGGSRYSSLVIPNVFKFSMRSSSGADCK